MTKLIHIFFFFVYCLPGNYACYAMLCYQAEFRGTEFATPYTIGCFNVNAKLKCLRDFITFFFLFSFLFPFLFLAAYFVYLVRSRVLAELWLHYSPIIIKTCSCQVNN